MWLQKQFLCFLGNPRQKSFSMDICYFQLSATETYFMSVQVIQAMASYKEAVLSGPYFLGHDCSLDRLGKLGGSWEGYWQRQLIREVIMWETVKL